MLSSAKEDLDLVDIAAEEFELMGVWDYFYGNIAVDQDLLTHYVKLQHYDELANHKYFIGIN